MNVATMVSLMGTLGIGESLNTNVSQATTLQFLNLAHDELFSKTANFNTDILVDETFTSDANVPSIQLDETPYLVSRVYVKNPWQPLPLIQTDILKLTDTIQSQYPPQAGTPKLFAKVGKYLNFFPFQTDIAYTFSIFYTPTNTALTIDTQENQLPYPIPYQRILVDGGLYYQALAEGGFRTTKASEEAKVRWMKGISDLEEYLKGFNTQTITTYKNL